MSEPNAEYDRMWDVTINSQHQYVIHAPTAAEAMSLAGDLYRAQYTGGQDVGAIEDIEAHVRRPRAT